MKQDDLPFPRGHTYYEGSTPPTTSLHPELEGKTYIIEDIDWGNTANTKPKRTGKYVMLMIVRNVSGGALAPKYLAKMKNNGTAYEFTGQISGQAALGDIAYPIDEFLPTSTGLPNNDMGYVVVSGPAMCTTDTAGTTTINISDGVVSGGGTAGRVVDQNVGVAAGSATFAQIKGLVGYAITATTGNSQDVLVDVMNRGGIG